jgi:hypothetical protein
MKALSAIVAIAAIAPMTWAADFEVTQVTQGDIALSPDGHVFVNGYKRKDENHYAFYNMKNGKHYTVTGLKRGEYLKGNVRLDPSPCWRRDGKAIAVPAIAEDGSRQTFIIEISTARLE